MSSVRPFCEKPPKLGFSRHCPKNLQIARNSVTVGGHGHDGRLHGNNRRDEALRLRGRVARDDGTVLRIQQAAARSAGIAGMAIALIAFATWPERIIGT